MSHVEGVGQTWSKKSLRWDPDILHNSHFFFLKIDFSNFTIAQLFSAARCQPYPLAFPLAWTVM